jgi:excisionase family DNA binding protein
MSSKDVFRRGEEGGGAVPTRLGTPRNERRTTTRAEESRNESEFGTIEDIAGLLQISARTVRRMASNGLIPCYRLSGKLLRFRVTEVLEAISRVRIPAGSEKTHQP